MTLAALLGKEAAALVKPVAKADPLAGAKPAVSNAIQAVSPGGINNVLLLRAIRGQESSGGRNLTNSQTGAAGPLQILPGKAGKLSPVLHDVNDTFRTKFTNRAARNPDQANKAFLLYQQRYRVPNDAGLPLSKKVWNQAASCYGGGVAGPLHPERRPRDGIKGPTVGEYSDSVVKRYNALLQQQKTFVP